MVMSNRIDGLIGKAVQSDANRLAMVSELHFTVKQISDEAFQYLLRVAKSLAVEDAGPVEPYGLIGQTRVVITGEGTAEVAIVWSHRAEVFLSSSYSRRANGGWHSRDGQPISPTWLVRLEERYQQKLREVEIAAKSEAVC
jgi:hypothetical protein